jgi:hypothetical protein
MSDKVCPKCGAERKQTNTLYDSYECNSELWTDGLWVETPQCKDNQISGIH